MAATLRAGLSLGLCGFTYWSHDAGGFVEKAPRNLYRRWLAFAALCSQTRCHGAPPREPWEYDEEFEQDFRRTLELRYQLLPYIYSQATVSSEAGYPLIRPLFFESPDDPTSWLIEDEYLLGSEMLVAPLIEEGDSRTIYLPPGRWVDYQSALEYEGSRWHRIKVGAVPVVLLAKAGSAIPHAKLVQSTRDLDWKHLEIRVFGKDVASATGRITLPGSAGQEIRLGRRASGDFEFDENPVADKVDSDVVSARPSGS